MVIHLANFDLADGCPLWENESLKYGGRFLGIEHECHNCSHNICTVPTFYMHCYNILSYLMPTWTL